MNNSRRPRPRRGNNKASSIVKSTVQTLATTAVVAFGAYKAYEYYVADDNAADDINDEGMILPKWISSLWLGDDDEEQEEEGGRRTRSGGAARKKNSGIRPSARGIDPRTRHRLAQQSIRKCRQEIRNAYATCWPALQQVIEDRTNTIPLTQELRMLRQKKNNHTITNESSSSSQQRQGELWQDIQTETFTKFVTTAYASSLLVLSLTLQLHWIGGQVFQQQQQQRQRNDGSSAAHSTARLAQEVMMQSHEYFKTQGLPLLIAAVRRAVVASPMGEWKPTTFVTLAELEHAMGRVDTCLERGTGGSSSYSRNWIRIVLPDPTQWNDDEDSYIGDDDEEGDHLLEESSTEQKNPLAFMLESLWDLAESPAWQDAQLQTLQTTQQYLRDKGWGKEFVQEPQQQQQQVGAEDAEKESKDSRMDEQVSTSSASLQLPLAKLMAPFKSSCGLVAVMSTVDDSESSGIGSAKIPKSNKKRTKSFPLLTQVQKLPAVLELGDVSFQELPAAR